MSYEGGRWKAVFWDDVDLSVYSTRIRYSGTSGIQVNHKERYRARIYYRDPAHVGTYSAWRYFVAKP